MSRSHLTSSSGASVVVDDTHFPFLIATWFGAPDAELSEFYFEWQAKRLARARAFDLKVATIVDCAEAERPPSSVRRDLADRSEVILEEFDPYIVHSWVVVQSALIRGVITALTWMTPMRLSMVPTVSSALQEGKRGLKAAGIPMPSHFVAADYQRPRDPKIPDALGVSWERTTAWTGVRPTQATTRASLGRSRGSRSTVRRDGIIAARRPFKVPESA